MTAGITRDTDYKALAAAALADHRRNRWYLIRKLMRRKAAMVSLAVVLVAGAAAVAAPLVSPYPAQGQGMVNVKERLARPSAAHLLGTDQYGRDVLSRVVYGARVSIFGGLLVMFLSALIGVPLGLWSGYREGLPGAVISRLVELVLSFPSLLLAMAISLMVGSGTSAAVMALIIPWWPWFTRLVHGEVLSVKRMQYVEAAQMLGYSRAYIMRRHLLPNILTPVIVMMLLDLGPAIIAIGGLSFLGLGTQPPGADWGLMVTEGAQNILSEWWIAVMPGCAMFLLVSSFNLFGGALAEVLGPEQH
jgi:peptide/nickel transport system permease protein